MAAVLMTGKRCCSCIMIDSFPEGFVYVLHDQEFAGRVSYGLNCT